MTNRFPLVFDTAGKSLEELPTGDNLDLTGSSVVNAINITASGTLQVGSVSANSVSINGTPLATVATTSDYNDLTNKPILFSGDYNDLTNKPGSAAVEWTDIANKPVIAARLSQLVNDTNFVTNAQINIIPSQVTGLSTIASTGSFSDLADVPNFVTNEQINGGTLTVEVSNTGDLQGSVFGNDSSIIVDHINNELTASKLTTDLIQSRDFSLVATDDIYIKTPQFFLLQTQSFEIRNDNAGTQIEDVDRIKFVGNVDFEEATVTGLQLETVTGDLKGSVFADDSSTIVDSINNVVTASTINGNTITSTSLVTDNISSSGPLTVTSNGGIQLLPNGIFNVPNATTISLSATSTVAITATDNLTLTSTSGNIVVNTSIVPDANEVYDIGSVSNRFRDLYLSGNTINLGSAAISLNPVTGLVSLPIDTATSLGLPQITAGINGFYGLSADFSEGRAINPATSTAIAPNADLEYFQNLNFGVQIFAYSKIVFATPIPGYGAGIEYDYFNFPEITNDGKTPPTIVADIDGSGNLLSLEITAIGDATGAGESLIFHPTGDSGSVNGGQVGLQDADGPQPIVTAPGGQIPGYISIANLKTLVAGAATYAAFQAAIAAL